MNEDKYSLRYTDNNSSANRLDYSIRGEPSGNLLAKISEKYKLDPARTDPTAHYKKVRERFISSIAAAYDRRNAPTCHAHYKTAA